MQPFWAFLEYFPLPGDSPSLENYYPFSPFDKSLLKFLLTKIEIFAYTLIKKASSHHTQSHL
jgi:hypothetical protein